MRATKSFLAISLAAAAAVGWAAWAMTPAGQAAPQQAALLAGNLTGQEEVQKDNAGWKPFLDFPELKRLMTSGEEIAEDEIVELTDLLKET